LQTALDNTNKAVSLIQTGEGALNEITRLLGKVRSLAVDSANLGVNDSKALAANQEEIKNALDTIDKIATSTKFGTKKIFDNEPLTFQIGANTSQTASVTLGDVTAASLGKGAVDGIDSLNAIDVSSPLNARNNIAVIDQAISEIANQRSKLGAFQANTIETNANHLRASLENLSARTSVIRDTDFATEMAQFTKSQVKLQAGSTVLGNANQIPQLVASLLRG
jgi:flagellin